MAFGSSSLRFALKIGAGGLVVAVEAGALPAEAVVGLVVVAVVGTVGLADRYLGRRGK